MSRRMTPSPVGAIIHRDTTELRPPGECTRGHVAPKYRGQFCVICARLNVLACRGDQPRLRRRKMRRYADYAEARADHAEAGGYLLDLGGGLYGVTDSGAVAERLRGRAWVRHCEAVGCWDELELAAGAPGS